MKKDTEVFCAGETMVMVAPNSGMPLSSDSTCVLSPGGAESNVATTLALLGHASAWGGAVGGDPMGNIVRSTLEAAGVDISVAKQVAGERTGVYFKDPSPEGTTVHYYRDNSAASKIGVEALPEWVATRPQIVHLSGITPALSQSCDELIDEIIVRRPFGNAVVSFDVNLRPVLWRGRDAGARLLELAQASDIVFVGRDEAEVLWGTSTAAEVRALIHAPQHLVVKDGDVGAHHFTGTESHFVAAPRVEVLEPVGAGDAFAAGWLSGYLQGRDPVQSLRLGHFIASRVLTSPTDSADFLTPVEREQIIARDPSEW